MENYLLNGKNLADYGLIPSPAENSNIAVTGIWDMPARIGKVYHEWPDDMGIEPYLRADEIFFGGRDLSFTALMRKSTREDALNSCYELFDDINAFAELVPFESKYGAYHVQVKDQIAVSHIVDGWCKLMMPFRQPIVDLSGAVPLVDNITPGIDNIGFCALGIKPIEILNEYNRPAVKAADSTVYGFENYKIGKPSYREIKAKFLVHKNSYEAFSNVIKGLFALFSAPGSRTLKYESSTREFFVKDGFKVSQMFAQGSEFIGVIEMSLVEIRTLNTWNLLGDQNGNILVDKFGTPLTEILKIN